MVTLHNTCQNCQNTLIIIHVILSHLVNLILSHLVNVSYFLGDGLNILAGGSEYRLRGGGILYHRK